jgi:hypothetical protein
MVSLTSSSGGYINGIHYANLELLIDKTSSIYLYVTFDFSTLYTTLPHDKLKTRLKEAIHKAFSHRNYGSKFVVLGYNSTYFSNNIQTCKTYYSDEQVISMLEFLIDSINSVDGGYMRERS